MQSVYKIIEGNKDRTDNDNNNTHAIYPLKYTYTNKETDIYIDIAYWIDGEGEIPRN